MTQLPKPPEECAFCGRDTDFLAHTKFLCIPCGDNIQQYDAKTILELGKKFAETASRYVVLVKAYEAEMQSRFSKKGE